MEERPSAVLPPLGFARLGDGIYRSAYPAPKSLRFVDSLHLRTMLCLAPGDVKKDLREVCVCARHTHGPCASHPV